MPWGCHRGQNRYRAKSVAVDEQKNVTSTAFHEIRGKVELGKEDQEMPNARDQVRKMLDGIPDDVSFEDIQYHIYVLEKVERGLRAADEGRLLAQEEVDQEISQWLKEWLGE